VSEHAPDEAQANEATGTFWLEGGAPVSGVMSRDPMGCRITTLGIAREPKSVHFEEGVGFRTMSGSGDPKDDVADNDPVPLLGTLEDGRQVTVLDARLAHTGPDRGQIFFGLRVLVGEHAPTRQTNFQAARVALPQARQWQGLLAGPAAVDVSLGDAAAGLRAYEDGGSLWIELTLHDGMVEREWERRFWNRCLTLLRLWTNLVLREERVQLSLTGEGSWAELVIFVDRESTSFTSHDSLLPPISVTLSKVAEALVLFDELAPVPDIASTRLGSGGTLEQSVLANAASLEGLHRACYEGSKPFPGIAKRGPIADAAAAAAAAAAVEAGGRSRKTRRRRRLASGRGFCTSTNLRLLID
jgi:hypothetical protein